MKKYKLTMTTILETDDLNLIKQDLVKMEFGEIPDVDTIVDQGPVLFKETRRDNRDAMTYISIDSRGPV